MNGKAEPITHELLGEAKSLLKQIKQEKTFVQLTPIFRVADYFIRGLSKSKKLRAEPDQAGIFDKRYVKKLQAKIFGKGQSESAKIKNPDLSNPHTSVNDQVQGFEVEAELKDSLPSLKEAQEEACNSDIELKALQDKRDVIRKELKVFSLLIQKRRSKVRLKVKKDGKWRVDERLFHSPIFRKSKLGVIRKVGKDVLGKTFEKLTGFHRTHDRVKRMGLKMELEETTYIVETVTDPETGRSVRASMDDIGPPNSNLTWSALSNLLKLHIEYVIPMNRTTAIIGDAYFSAANQCRWFADTARDFLPIYIELFEQLADSSVWQGDDTTTKVLDITPSIENDALQRLVENELPFGFDLKNGKGKKSKLNVSFVTGRVGNDPRGVIRFYRTHLGSFGNLVSELLSRRSGKAAFKEIILHGDLSTTNLPSSEYSKKFKNRMGGCTSHARRPFWDERLRIDACGFFLRGFQLLSYIEEDHGKYRFKDPKSLHKRTKYSRWIWSILRRGALTVINQKRQSPGVLISYQPVYWPQDSTFRVACQYIVNHYDELTLYLDHHELEWTNNLSERAQRKEKLMLHSSFFRKSREGRVVIDILKTIMATAQAAQINFENYLQFVTLNKQDVKENPHLYTPLAFAQKQMPHAKPSPQQESVA